jgi:hypothetical protein
MYREIDGDGDEEECGEQDSEDERNYGDNGGVPIPLSGMVNSRADDERNNNEEYGSKDGY